MQTLLRLVLAASISAASAQTIPEVAINAAPEFETLVAALTAADLVDVLSGDGPFTVFAPTNAAFDKLPPGTVESLLQPENKQALIDILTYHVVPGKILSTDLSDGQEATTLQGDVVVVTIADGTVKINEATVSTPDVEASNGVIHIIDSVLIPPNEPTDAPSAATDDTPAEPTQSIVEIAVNDSRFSTLVAALQAADLVDALSGDGPFTVFAPTNEAFDALGDTVTDLLKPENKEQLQQVLLYHVLGTELLSTDLTDGLQAETLQGGKVIARLDPVRINSANVIQADIRATNGVIHALDAVLIPCQDDSAWHKKNEPAKDCAWVAQWAPRCNVKGEDNIRAWYGCPAACGTTCTDSGAWFKKGDDEKDCAWVASHPSEARCLVRGEDDTLAKDACPSACAPQ